MLPALEGADMRERVRDYVVLVAAAALLTLPNLGAPSLWDVDEGVNAEAAREMRENDTWVIPTFNFKLRTAKPVMLYWLQRISYAAFGVNEWSARLPSVLASWATALLVYELARRMFNRATGLLAGIVLVSALEVCVLAHAATPDAVLLLFTVLTFYLFWARHENGSRRWWVPTAAACGLAVLTKGPVGVALPGLVLLLYFAWNRELGRLLDRKIFRAVLMFLLVIGPWYGLVTAETRGQWLRSFLGNENLNRFVSPMQNHHGPLYYHAAALMVLFVPWSAFLLAAVWYGIRGAKNLPPSPLPSEREGTAESSSQGASFELPLPSEKGLGGGFSPRPFRFLVCWFGSYLVFFSVAATKLPNYILPLYPALAILTARFLIRWRDGELQLPKWLMPAGVAGLAFTALAVGLGILIAGNTVPVLPPTARTFPGLGPWAVIGLVPLATAVVMAFSLRAGNRDRFVHAAGIGAVVFTGLTAAFPALVIDPYKAPKELVRASGVDDPSCDVRLAHCDWFQPSVVFYARREVVEMMNAEKVAEFFSLPTPGYLFIPEKTWTERVEPKMTVPTQVVAKHYDFYRNCDVLVVTNNVTATAGR
ncbi:glycosyltransferase family 39 protein [Gemmata sp. JC673]|uniref:Glycosyltransferase family 39 protein n=1 Tax=Gemmata algarum TaxID=2975278 RepID=A0ABU5EV97_9BACT|nr:glycosyltransferase family 39 protein [Gemmata algarum]MDY3558893.1 glycosyltransferase family 39 protein [Gemmata algarum]